MKDWLRRIRGMVGMGLTWAAAWIPVGVLFALGLWVVGLDPPGFAWTVVGVFGAVGFVGGSAFSAVLGLAEGRRRFDELALPRFALWGGVGGLLAGGLAGLALLGGPGLQAIDLAIAGVTTLLGAGSAAGSLALARRAEGDALLAASADLGEVGLTDEESERLLGDAG